MLKVKNIIKYYGSNMAVDNLSFEVQNGEIFGLLGANGAGKTTTFRIIMGLLDANHGSVTLDGKKIDYKLVEKIGFVTEERSLLTKLTVNDQLIYYGILKGMSEDEIVKKMDYWLDRFKISEYKNRKIKELSKGNQQKIQFIAAIINDPKLLILDEPFTGLDPINVKMFKEAILELKDNGCSIIFSSHQMEHIEEFCEKLVILVKGKVVLEGYLNDIKKEYQKQNIFIHGDVDASKLEKITGVLEVTQNSGEYVVRIVNKDVVKNVFSIVSKFENITKFVVEEASLNEIFISKVGESYEK
ncbi:MAG: ATP-binding cassette domain-containing protein [Bacilli bacterium]|nr:ATP-binding cassette domain-containing protein [Bacilli bacterium]